jgi:putative transcription factor
MRAEIEGAELMVCRECARLGKVLRTQEEAPRAAYIPRRETTPLMEPFELIDDFGTEIKKARERLGLTREQLAKKIFEKESVLQRIEANELEPSDELVLKLEKALNIRLRV